MMIVAAHPLAWTGAVLASFASQYGSPWDYPILARAKLLSQWGTVAQLLDVVQQAVLAPYAKKTHKPKSVLPSLGEKRKETLTPSEKKNINRMLGIKE